VIFILTSWQIQIHAQTLITAKLNNQVGVKNSAGYKNDIKGPKQGNTVTVTGK
jgi:hypothetical protein